MAHVANTVVAEHECRVRRAENDGPNQIRNSEPKSDTAHPNIVMIKPCSSSINPFEAMIHELGL